MFFFFSWFCSGVQLRVHYCNEWSPVPVLHWSHFCCLPGYQPCDPQVICNRVNHVSSCLEELKQLAVKRRSELEESRQLWAFFQVGHNFHIIHTGHPETKQGLNFSQALIFHSLHIYFVTFQLCNQMQNYKCFTGETVWKCALLAVIFEQILCQPLCMTAFHSPLSVAFRYNSRHKKRCESLCLDFQRTEYLFSQTCLQQL